LSGNISSTPADAPVRHAAELETKNLAGRITLKVRLPIGTIKTCRNTELPNLHSDHLKRFGTDHIDLRLAALQTEYSCAHAAPKTRSSRQIGAR
jgi:hypothetical protein